MRKVTLKAISFIMAFLIMTGFAFVFSQGTLIAFANAADDVEPSYREGIYGDFKYWVVSLSNSVPFIEIGSYKGNKKEVVIPDKIEERYVRGISAYAFSENNTIEKILFPDTLLYIEYNAFEECKSLKSIVISENVTSIDEDAFKGCSNLKIYGKEGSYAETYARKYNIPFVKYVFENGVTLNKSSLSLTKGDTETLNAVIAPTDATDRSLSWTTSDSSVANVSNGTVTAVGTGKAVITVSTVNGKKASCDVSVKAASAISLDKTAFSARSVFLGQSVTISCNASGGVSPYKYAVYYRLGSGSWYTLQNYKTNSKIKFTPSKMGVYQISIKAKDSEGTITKKYYNISVFSDKYTLANSSFLSSENIELGNIVKITAKGCGGTNFYQYAIYVRKTGVENWTTVSGYSSNNIAYFKPDSQGTYEFSIKVKDSAGKSAKKTIMLNVSAASTKLKNNSVISSTKVFSGDAVCIDAYASGGSGYYIYGCYVKKSDENEWYVVRAFSSENHFVFSLYESGVYQVCIRVKDSGGTTSKKYFDINVDIDNAGIINRSTVSAGSIRLGESVNMKGIAEGGAKYYEYAMYYRLKGDEEWLIIQNFGVNSEVSFTPDTAGQYELCINVSDSVGVNDKKYFSLRVVK